MFGGAACGAQLVLHAGATPALGLAVGLLAVVTAGATLAAGKPGAWWTAASSPSQSLAQPFASPENHSEPQTSRAVSTIRASLAHC